MLTHNTVHRVNEGGAEALRNDESETVDSDTSDHEDWTKSSAKVVLPMGQRLHELLQGESSPASIQENSKRRQKGKSTYYDDIFCKIDCL